MSSRHLDRMKLDPRVLKLLEKEGIQTARDLLSADTYQLIGKTGLGYNELKELRLHVSSRVVPQPVTASAMLQTQLASRGNPSTVTRDEPSKRLSYHLPTGITTLDNFLHGGIVVGGITEVVGAPGIGKTQLCLNCCAEMLLFPSIAHVMGSEEISGSLRSVVYIDTELKFSPDRLAEILVHRIMDEENASSSSSSSGSSRSSSSSYPVLNTTRRNELFDIVKSKVLHRVKVFKSLTIINKIIVFFIFEIVILVRLFDL